MIVTSTIRTIVVIGVRTGPRRIRAIRSMASGVTTIANKAAVTSRPTVSVRLAPALIALLGKMGGHGATASVTSAIFTAGWGSIARASATATSGITTKIDATARKRMPGRRRRLVASLGIAASPMQKTLSATLACSPRAISVAIFMAGAQPP
jgi:hypothetical protein